MQKVRELFRRVQAAHPADTFFDVAIEAIAASKTAKAHYKAYDRALSVMDAQSRETLYTKAVRHFLDHRPGQLKQGFFNQLNECFAYRHLLHQGYQEINVLDENRANSKGKRQSRQPDIGYLDAGEQCFCEVKSVGISDDEIKIRGSGEAFSTNYHQLSDEFFQKLNYDITQANEQIKSAGKRGIVYIVVTYDDFSRTYYKDNRVQLRQFLNSHSSKNIYIKSGIVGNRRIYNF